MLRSGTLGNETVNRPWVVLLEAAGDMSGAPLEPERLRELMRAMGCDQIVGLHNPYRCAIQLRISSSSPAEALFTVTTLWADAARQYGVDHWTLERTEVMTPDEYERDCAVAEIGDNCLPQAPPSEADDLLRNVFYDSLTSFPTLALFRDRARAVATSCASSRRGLAVLLLDIDGFGKVNRELGYTYGDQVLVEVASRLAHLEDALWAAGRVGGDEFALLVDDVRGSADAVATRVVDAVRAPIVVNGRTITLSASVGVAPFSAPADLDDCLHRAGAAMCAVKAAGGAHHGWYEPGLAVDTSRVDFDTRAIPDRQAYIALLERAALAANECTTLEEASTIVLQQICAHTGWRAGHLWIVDGTGSGLRPTGVWHVSGPDPLDAFRRETERHITAGDGGLPGRVLRTGKPACSADGWWPVRAAAAEAGICCTAGFPVVVGADVVAVLEFFGPRPMSPDESLLDAMAAVGAQLGRVVERARAASVIAKSEDRYRLLADSLPALVWVSDPNAQCTFFNRRWLEFTGRALEDEVGDGWTAGVHPDDFVACLDTYKSAFSRRQTFEMEYRLRRWDGEYRWVIDRGSPLFDGDEFLGYIGGCADITERRMAEEGFRREEERFRALVCQSDVNIVVLGADGRLIDEFVPGSTLGYEPGAAQGQVGFEYVHPDDRAAVMNEFLHVIGTPGPGRPYDLRVRHSDGSWRWLRARAHNMLADPLVEGIVVSSTDVTEQRNLAERLRATEARLRIAEERLREFQDVAPAGVRWTAVGSDDPD